MRINLRSFKFCMIYCSRARTFNGWLIRTRPFANIPRADRKITPMFDWRWHLSQWKQWWEVTMSTKTSSCRETLLASHTVAARAVQIFTVFIFEYGASIWNIQKFAPFESFLLYDTYYIDTTFCFTWRCTHVRTWVSIVLAQHQMFFGGYVCMCTVAVVFSFLMMVIALSLKYHNRMWKRWISKWKIGFVCQSVGHKALKLVKLNLHTQQSQSV